MLKKIFDVEDGKVIVTPEIKLIPEFNALLEKYENPIAALSFVYFMTSPESPYTDVPERDKEEIISNDVGGDFSFEDEEIEAALKKAELLYTTPTRRFFFDAKIGLEKMGEFLRSQEITTGFRDGNDTTFLTMLKSLGRITKEFKELEKEYQNEAGSNLRGGHEASYDE